MNRKSLTALIAILSAILVACIVVGFILLREDTGSDKKTDGTGSALVVDGTGEGQADPTGDSAGVVNTDNKKPGTESTEPNGETQPEQSGDPDDVDPDDPDDQGNSGNNGGNNSGSNEDEESTEPTVGVEEGTEATTDNDLVIDFDDLINAGKH